MDHIIDGVFTLVAGFGGYLIARWQFNSQRKLDAEEKKFLLLYRPYFNLCGQKYWIDVSSEFSSFALDDQQEIIGLVREYDYLTTKDIQEKLYAVNRLSMAPQDEEIATLLDNSYDELHEAMVSEYERICALLGYTP